MKAFPLHGFAATARYALDLTRKFLDEAIVKHHAIRIYHELHGRAIVRQLLR